tara:strand:- start:17431 stop:17982 length:552 start_codon:yes stop_codon:yes gene_type:complete
MSDNTPSKKVEKKDNKPEQSTPFWKKHFLKLFLFVLLIVSVLWGWIANHQLKKEHAEEITTLKEDHEAKMFDLKKQKTKEQAQVLALAVRSEMIDENMDQVNQYFLQVLKQPGIEKIMLVNHKSGKVLLSTNKKDENTKYQKEELLKTADIKLVENKDSFETATPIMGLNNQLAVLIVVSSNS